MALKPGARLGSYEVVSPLGRGGMGEVYRARDTRLHRDVALKVLPDALAGDPTRLARFRREAQVLAALNHPNIATIYGLEEPAAGQGAPTLVMELVEGPTLADRIVRGPLPIDEALAIARQIADALEAAHEQGIIHRDVKPSNIKVRPDGTVKVLDFGLAKALDPNQTEPRGFSPEAVDADAPTVTSPATLTRAGVLLGTAAYMAPEQAMGKAVDRRADLWAFGVVLYEMLTGRRAFEGTEVTEILAGIIKSDPDWSALPAGLPPAIRTCLRRCLQKSPRQRLQAIGDARLALEGAFDVPVSDAVTVQRAAPASGNWRRAALWTVAGVALGGLVAVLFVRTLAPPPNPPPTARLTIPLGLVEGFPGRGRGLAISPDGRQVIYRTSEGLWLRPLAEPQARLLPGTAGANWPFFSPDGRSIGFHADWQIKTMLLPNGTPLAICDVDQELGGVTWAEDNTIVYVTRFRGGIWRVAAGGAPQPLLELAPGEDVGSPQILPGGEWLLFSLSGPAEPWDEGRIVVQSLDTNERRTLVEGARDASYRAGRLLFVQEGVLVARPFDLRALVFTGERVVLAENVRVLNQNWVEAIYAMSHAGTLVYSGALPPRVRQLVWKDRPGNEEAVTAIEPGPWVNPRISPDGTRVALQRMDPEGWRLWIWDIARGRASQLTFGPGLQMDPVWTRDGTSIVYGSSHAAPQEPPGLFQKAADGTGGIERLTKGETGQLPIMPSNFSPDGRLVFVDNPTRSLVELVPGGDRATRTLLGPDGTGTYPSYPALSPDGTLLAFAIGGGVANSDGRGTIRVRTFPDVQAGQWRIEATGARIPIWSRTDQELFFRVDDAMMAVPYETSPTFAPLAPRRLFDLSSSYHQNYDVAPDGRFLFAKALPPTPEDQRAANELVVILNPF